MEQTNQTPVQFMPGDPIKVSWRTGAQNRIGIVQKLDNTGQYCHIEFPNSSAMVNLHDPDTNVTLNL